MRDPVRCAASCPNQSNLVCSRTINPGKAIDLTLPLEQVAEGYRAMDERRADCSLMTWHTSTCLSTHSA